jgi:phosphoribosyl 1,2-cyclic phosphodiesterase
MKITVWGARGSIPAPGRESLRYGGNTTCLEVRPHEGGVIIIDAGSGIRVLGKKLLQEPDVEELALLLTHSHWDHLVGFPFFTPAYFSRFRINVYGGPSAQDSLKQYLSHQMTPPFFPVDFSAMKANFAFGDECPTLAQIGLVEIETIPLSHPNGGYGFKLTKRGKTFVFLTDNEPDFPHPGGLTRDDYIDFCRGVDLLFHDAQYNDEEYARTRGWGHSTYAQVLDLALAAGVKRLGLFHHDPERTDDALDGYVETCRAAIRDAGSTMECFAAAEGMEIEL